MSRSPVSWKKFPERNRGGDILAILYGKQRNIIHGVRLVVSDDGMVHQGTMDSTISSSWNSLNRNILLLMQHISERKGW
jgi:hypothetical protein